MSNSKPPFFSRLNLSGFTAQIFLIAVIPLSILLFIITFGSLALHQDAMRNLVGVRDERTARSAASALKEQLNHRASQLNNSALRAADGVPLNDILTSLDFLQVEFDYGLSFYTTDGVLLAASGDNLLWNNIEEYNDYPLQEVLMEAEPHPQFSTPFLHSNGDDFIVLVFIEIEQDDTIVVGAFSVTALARQTLTGTITFDEEAGAFLVDNNGQILFQTGTLKIANPTNTHPGVQEALRGESGTTYITEEGKEHVVAFSPILPTNWALVIEEPWDVVASPLLRYTEAGPLILVPVLVFALAALWFGTRQIIQPLRDLEARSSALAWGDFQAVKEPVGGISEITRLQNALIHLAGKVQSAQQGLRGYIGAITAGQEEERRRLARDLHDDTIQSLIALNQKVQLARRSLEENSTGESLDEIQEVINQTIQDLRRLTGALRPLYLEDLGLTAAMDMLARETSKANRIPVHFISEGVEKRLSAPEEMTLFRMAQEGLSNITRHSKATHATLSLNYKPEEVVMRITDNGQGFEVPENPAEFAPQGHFGLLGMHERAELIGAGLEIQSAPEDGSTLVITIPVQSQD
jgi:signal transduction histidine kinase